MALNTFAHTSFPGPPTRRVTTPAHRRESYCEEEPLFHEGATDTRNSCHHQRHEQANRMAATPDVVVLSNALTSASAGTEISML
jgi:hypothetical protein